MSIAAYRPPFKSVTIDSADGDMNVPVYGITPHAITAILQMQGDEARAVYIRAISGEFNEMDAAQLVASLVDDMPLLLALAIAFALGEGDKWETVLQMPIDTQVVLFEAALEMTFKREGGAKKLFETISNLLGNSVDLSNPEALMNGSEESGQK